MQAVILAGGMGTRLAERLNGRPKPLVDVAGIPLLSRQIETLKANGVDRVLLLINHAADQIARFCAENENFGIDVQLKNDGEPLGTAGALLASFEALDERFLVVYGDTLFAIDVERMVSAHVTAKADLTLLVHPNDHPADSDLIMVDDVDYVTGFRSYPHLPNVNFANLVNAAFYVVEKTALASRRHFRTPSDLAKHLFPELVDSGARIFAYRSFEYIKDLGTPARLDQVQSDLESGRVDQCQAHVPQRCVFLDRDGTLNAHIGYVRSREELSLLPDAGSALRRLNKSNWRVAIVTNQPVIARGDCTAEDLRLIHNKLETALGREGAFVDGIWLCPHHPHSGYAGERPELKIDCDCRKPKPGLIFEAGAALNADLARSWLVGDSTSDLLAARRAGVTSILVETGEAGRDGKYPIWPDFSAPNLSAAADLILEDVPRWELSLEKYASSVEPGGLVVIDTAPRKDRHLIAAVLARILRRMGIVTQWIPDRFRATDVLTHWRLGQEVELCGVPIPPNGVLIIPHADASHAEDLTDRRVTVLNIESNFERRSTANWSGGRGDHDALLEGQSKSPSSGVDMNSGVPR